MFPFEAPVNGVLRRKYKQFLIWKNKSLDQRRYVLFLSVIVGVASGLAAVVIKKAVHAIESLVELSLFRDYHNFLYFGFPLVGLLITVTFIKYIIKEPIGHGIPTTLYSISKLKARIPRNKIWTSIVTSAFTVGFGGSTGLEGPTVATAAAIGSNLGRIGRVNFRVRALLIGCAAAGAMASIFQAPVAAIVFALEVFMLDLTMWSLIPLLMSSIAAVLTSKFFMGDLILFPVDIHEGFSLVQLPFFIALGICTGLVSLYFSNTYFNISKRFSRIKKPYPKAIIGGIILGFLIFLLPPLYGEGYDTINALINDNPSGILDRSLFVAYSDQILVVLAFIVALVFLKIVATTITFSSGGVGGVFAPTLFMGSAIGFVFAKGINLLGFVDLPVTNFSLVAMAGLMAGVLHAPLMAMFLIAEITGGYELFIPLMITVAISFTTSKLFLSHTIYTAALAKKGALLTHHADKNVLSLLRVSDLVERHFVILQADWKLKKLVEVITKSKRNIFPVVSEDGSLLGIVFLDEVREIIFDQDNYETTTVMDLMTSPPATIDYGEPVNEVVDKFERSNVWMLPVLRDDKFFGFVSKSRLFNAYRKMLVEFSED